MEQTKGYTGDHASWQGKPCKECGKNHPSWVHEPVTPAQAARQLMVKQMRSTAYVFANPKKYDKTRQAESVARLELRMAEYDVAIAERTISRLERLEIRRAKREIAKAKEKLVIMDTDVDIETAFKVVDAEWEYLEARNELDTATKEELS